MPGWTHKNVITKEQLYDYQIPVTKIQRDLNQIIQDFYTKLSVEIANKTVKQRASQAATAVNKFERQLNEYIAKNRAWNKEIRTYLKNFDTINTLNSDLYFQMGLDNKKKIKELITYASPQQKEMINKVTQDLLGQGMKAEFVKPVKEIIYRNTLLGTPLSEGKQILRNFVLGDKKRLGKLDRYAGQVTRDALSQYDGQVNAMIAEQYELDSIQYIGSLVNDSRPFCRHVINQMGGVIKKEQLPELLSRFQGSPGMIPGTNEENFMVYRGGYNCRHVAIAFNQNN